MFLCIAAIVFFQCLGCYQLEVVSTTQRPDYQQKFLLSLNELSNQLLKLELTKCQENQGLKELQTSMTDIKKILTSQSNTESEKRIKLLEEDLENLSKNFTEAKIQLQKLVTDFEKLDNSKIVRTSCYDILKNGDTVDGVHVIRPNNAPTPFAVRCNMDVMGGGWTYVLNRADGSQNFDLKWEDYKGGFGDVKGEFWLGLQHLYELTGLEDNELLVEVVDWDNKKAYALYDKFRLGSEAESYPIKVLTGFNGDAGDSLSYHLGSKFSTSDHDNDKHSGNCAAIYHGAWWYKECHLSHLTGTYFNYNVDNPNGINWHAFRKHYSLKEARMMIRCRNQ